MNYVLRKVPFYHQPLYCLLKSYALHNSSSSVVHMCDPVCQLINRVQRNEIQNIDFTYDRCDRVVVYTDGCCFNNNTKDVSKRRSGIGVYWGDVGHPLNLSVPVLDNLQTSNRAELLAAHAAVVIAAQMKIPTLCLRLDSSYVKNGCEKWLHRWYANHWLTFKGTPVKNKDLWKPFSRDLQKLDIKFEKVNDLTSEGQKNAHNLANSGASLVN